MSKEKDKFVQPMETFADFGNVCGNVCIKIVANSAQTETNNMYICNTKQPI